MMQPTALIIRTSGTNCDMELAHAFALAGADPMAVHLNHLIDQPRLIDQAQLIGFPGGFSYGDDIAAGRIFANRLRHRLFEPLIQAIRRKVAMIGICNGFQVLVKLGLLPDPLSEADHDASGPTQTVTLADNRTGRFIDRWVRLRVPADTACIWTRGLDELELPIAHGEGRFVPESQQTLRRLEQRRQIALCYDGAGPVNPTTQRDEPSHPSPSQASSQASSEIKDFVVEGNPNGSVGAVAGICDPTGLVLGLMPHPERYTHPTHHPLWARRRGMAQGLSPAGLRMFQNAVAHVRAIEMASMAV